MIINYQFPKSSALFYLKGLYKERGYKTFYEFLNRQYFRPLSRALIWRYAPKGIGLEIGVGARTIAPVRRTILSDGYHAHGVEDSIAKEFFRADEIPYKDESLSFILSEHMLEHATNPIKILKEWSRVLQKSGKIFLSLPHRDRGTDRFRERTTLSHLISDFENDVAGDDDFHLGEWIENVVDRGLMPDHYKGYNREELVKTGCIHHHVWVTEDIVELLEYCGFKVCKKIDRLYDRRDSFFVVAEKT